MSMHMYLLLILQLWSATLLNAQEVSGNVCQLASPNCPQNQHCIPTSSNQALNQFGDFSSDGVCASLKTEGQSCKIHGLQNSCAPGFTCLPMPLGALEGICINVYNPEPALSNTEALETYNRFHTNGGDVPELTPLVKAYLRLNQNDSLTNFNCKYFPGNYVFGDPDQTQCCGIAKSIRSESSSDLLSAVYYCDYIVVEDNKDTLSPSFCGYAEDGTRLRWIGPPASATNPMPAGRCSPQPAYPPDVIADIPVPSLDQTTCAAEFPPEIEEDRIGLMSRWEADNFITKTDTNTSVHVDDFIAWFRSHPNKNHYVPGDELFILSWIWLFKNTDIDSKRELNFFLRDQIATPLYNILDKFYAKSYRQAYDLIKFLEDNKECMEVTGAFSLQSRYTINKFLHEGLVGSLRGYQCGSDAIESSTAACQSQQDEFFSDKFLTSFNMANQEYDDCHTVRFEGTNCTKSGNHDRFYQGWNDPERHKFIVNSIKETHNGKDTGSWRNGPFNNLGLDGLADPPINSQWVPQEFIQKDIAGLWTKARLNASNENVKLPGSAELYPIYHWSLIVDPQKFSLAFPEQLGGKPSFLHYNSSMEYISNESQALVTANYPSMVDPVNRRWNGPQMIATNAAHLMELYSSTDGEFDRPHLHFKKRFQKYLVRHHLTRLFQYYYTKMQSIEEEQSCLHDKIKEISRGLGHNVDAPDWDPVAIRLEKTPKCSALAGGVSFGSGSIISDSNEGPLAIGIVPLEGPTKQNSVSQAAGSNTSAMNIGGMGAGLGGAGVLGGATLSLSTAKGPIGLAGGNSGTFARAVKEGFNKRKERLMLEHKKYAEETANNPIVKNIMEMESQKGSNSFFTPLSRYKGSSNTSLASLSGLTDPAKEANQVTSVDSGATPMRGTLADDSVASSPAINLGGSKTSPVNLPGHTGLSNADQQQILKAIGPSTYEKNEKDSLWLIINKAYVRSYKKLFDSQ
jgi:hypothetical protein